MRNFKNHAPLVSCHVILDGRRFDKPSLSAALDAIRFRVLARRAVALCEAEFVDVLKIIFMVK